MNRSVCRACGHQVLWAMTPEGGRVELDARPHEEGEWVVNEQGAAVHDPRSLLPRHRLHAEACPG